MYNFASMIVQRNYKVFAYPYVDGYERIQKLSGIDIKQKDEHGIPLFARIEIIPHKNKPPEQWEFIVDEHNYPYSTTQSEFKQFPTWVDTIHRKMCFEKLREIIKIEELGTEYVYSDGTWYKGKRINGTEYHGKQEKMTECGTLFTEYYENGKEVRSERIGVDGNWGIIVFKDDYATCIRVETDGEWEMYTMKNHMLYGTDIQVTSDGTYTCNIFGDVRKNQEIKRMRTELGVW